MARRLGTRNALLPPNLGMLEAAELQCRRLERTCSGGAQILRTSSELAALAMLKLALQASELHQPASPLKAREGRVGKGGRLRPGHRSLLLRLLVTAVLVAYLTGTTSYRMHMALRREQDGGRSSISSGGVTVQTGAAALAGLRSWLSVGGGSSRRSLRERPGIAALAGSTAANEVQVDAAAAAAVRNANAVGVQLRQHWYLLDNPSDATLEQQAAEEQEGTRSTILQQLLKRRRQHSGSVRLYDLESQEWIPHNITKLPPEMPVAYWAAASMPNKAKKRESSLLLAGGHMSGAEAAAGRPPRPPAPPGLEKRQSAASTWSCPQASASVFSVNPYRGKIKVLPPMPQPRFRGTAVVAGARLHFLGGYATDRSSKRASPAAEHWSLGLNGDGSSAPEWQWESPLPGSLVGRPLSAVPLTPEDEFGEPALFVWARPAATTSASSEDSECFVDSPATVGSKRKASSSSKSSSSSSSSKGSSISGGSEEEEGRVQLWSYAKSTGWQQKGLLPKPLADDFQCAVASSHHTLLAVGAVERTGLFTWQRGVWQYDAHSGGTWIRAGSVPAEFEGPLCALHDGRLFISSVLPQQSPEEEAQQREEGEDMADGAEEEGEEQQEEQAVAAVEGKEQQQEAAVGSWTFAERAAAIEQQEEQAVAAAAAAAAGDQDEREEEEAEPADADAAEDAATDEQAEEEAEADAVDEAEQRQQAINAAGAGDDEGQQGAVAQE